MIRYATCAKCHKTYPFALPADVGIDWICGRCRGLHPDHPKQTCAEYEAARSKLRDGET